MLNEKQSTSVLSVRFSRTITHSDILKKNPRVDGQLAENCGLGIVGPLQNQAVRGILGGPVARQMGGERGSYGLSVLSEGKGRSFEEGYADSDPFRGD